MSEPDIYLGRTIRNGSVELQSLIGGGGMGRVYRGVDLNLGRTVAVKILHPQSQNMAAAKHYFDREAHATAKLFHPNIIQIFDRGQEPDGTLYFMMEYVAGRNLADVLEQEFPLAPDRVVRVLAQILTALEVAHNVGIVHRDLKPENIMLQDIPGNPDFVKVLDFGVAKAPGDDVAGPMTVAGLVMGTPHFMSPEQALGHDIDPRSDLYSVGAMLYQMLTAELPFEGQMVMHVLAKVISEKPEPPSQRRSDLAIDPQLESICLRAMRKPKEGRFQSAAEFRNALLEIVNRPAAPPPRPSPSEDEIRRADLEPFLNRSRSAVADSVIDFVSAHRDMDVGGRPMPVAVLALYLLREPTAAQRAELHHLFEAEVRRHGGVVVSQMGLVSTALFGYPRRRDDDVRDALLAGRTLHQVLSRRLQGLALRIGLTYGEAVIPTGEVAAAYGTPLDTALRLASAPIEEPIIADDSIRDSGTVVRLKPTESRGLWIPHIDDFLVARPKTQTERAIPLLGRDSETNALRRLISRVTAGKPVALAVTGPTGIGKTRMLRFLVRAAESEHISVLDAPVERMSAAIPGLVLARIVRAAKELLPIDNIEGLAANTHLSSDDIFVLQNLLRGETPPDRAAFWVESLTSAMVALLRSLAQQRPVLIVCDCFDNIDVVSFTVLSSIVDGLANERFALVVAGNPEAGVTLAFAETHHELPLAPINDDLVDQLLVDLLPEMPAPLRLAVVKRVAGLPMNLSLLLDLLRAKMPQSADELPADPLDLMAAKLGALPEAARKLAAIAGALGESFPLDALSGSCPKSWDLRGNLQLIGEAGLLSLHEDEDRVWLRFEPAELASFARAQVPPETLFNIHKRVAGYYERTRRESSPPDVEFQWARHLDAAGQGKEAVHLFAVAADKTYAAFGPVATLPVLDALLNAAHQYLPNDHKAFQSLVLKAAFYLIKANHHQDALGLLEQLHQPTSDARRCELDVLRGECLAALGQYKDGADLLRDALACMPDGMHTLAAHAYLQLAQCFEGQGMLREAVIEAQHAVEAVGSLPEPPAARHRELSWRPNLLIGRVFTQSRHYPRALSALELGRRGALLQKDAIGLARVAHQMAIAFRAVTRLDDAYGAYEEALEAATRCGDPESRARLLHEMATLMLEREELEAAQELFAQSLATARNAVALDLIRANEGWLRQLTERFGHLQTQLTGPEDVADLGQYLKRED